MESNLFECIRQVKQKFKQNAQCITSNLHISNNQNQKNNRTKSVPFINKIDDASSKLIPVLELKDKLLKLREIEVKKYRKELAEVINKNEELTKYCQNLGNQFANMMSEVSGRNIEKNKAGKRHSIQNSKLKIKSSQCVPKNKDCKKLQENSEPNMKENNNKGQKKPISIKLAKDSNNKKKLVNSKSGKNLTKRMN